MQNQLDLFIIILSFTFWFSSYPSKGGFVGPIFLLLIANVLYGYYNNLSLIKPVIRNESAIIPIIFLFLLHTPNKAFENSYHIIKEREKFSKGFYKYMYASPAFVEDHIYLKRLIEENTVSNDKVLFWKIMSLDYFYIQRTPAILPYISLDNFIYLTTMGKEIERKILKKIEQNPPKVIIKDVRGQERYGFGELGNPRGTKNSFPLVNSFINNNYKLVSSSPHRNYQILIVK